MTIAKIIDYYAKTIILEVFILFLKLNILLFNLKIYQLADF